MLSKNNYEGIRIFSDSPDLIEKHIFMKLHQNTVIDKGGEPVDVFIRMANHKGLIASNSSFSLWAGILGDVENFSIPFLLDEKCQIVNPRFKKNKRYECYL